MLTEITKAQTISLESRENDWMKELARTVHISMPKAK